MLIRVLFGCLVVCLAFAGPQLGQAAGGDSLSPVLAGALSRGDAAAPVTIVEYTDLQCPYCRTAAAAVDEVLEKYAGKVRLVLKHCPLEKHAMAMPAALYLEAIARQDTNKAWAFFHRVLREQERLKEGDRLLRAAAAELGLDGKRLERDMAGSEVKTRIAADLAEADRFDVSGVPAFIINGKLYEGSYSAEELSKIIEGILATD